MSFGDGEVIESFSTLQFKAHFRTVLIDGGQLAEYMIDNGVGVTEYKTYTVKKLDGDYFEGV